MAKKTVWKEVPKKIYWFWREILFKSKPKQELKKETDEKNSEKQINIDRSRASGSDFLKIVNKDSSTLWCSLVNIRET